MNYPCGFAVLKGNDHLWKDGKCIVCKIIK